MIDFIEGTVEGKAPGELVLCAGGVGFLLLCSNSTLAQAPARGEKWRCYTVLNVARMRWSSLALQPGRSVECSGGFAR